MMQIIIDKVLDVIKDELLDDDGNIENEIIQEIEKFAGVVAAYIEKKFCNTNDEQTQKDE